MAALVKNLKGIIYCVYISHTVSIWNSRGNGWLLLFSSKLPQWITYKTWHPWEEPSPENYILARLFKYLLSLFKKIWIFLFFLIIRLSQNASSNESATASMSAFFFFYVKQDNDTLLFKEMKIHMIWLLKKNIYNWLWNFPSFEIQKLMLYSGSTFNLWTRLKKKWSGEDQRPLTQALAQNPSCLQITCKFNAAKHSYLRVCKESIATFC